MTAATQTPISPPPEALDLLRAGGALPILLVMVEQGHIVDVRVATRSTITAHLAAASFTSHGGNACNANAGRSPSSSD